MAKRNETFAFNGELFVEEGKYYIREVVKGEVYTYDLTKELDELVGLNIGISAKTEKSIDPIE